MISRLKRMIPAFFFIVMGGACGIFIGKVLDRILPEDAGTGFTIACFGLLAAVFYLAVILQIAIHEAGHLLFGLVSGYRFVSYRIFSLMWIRDGEHIRFRRFSLAGTGGQCLMEPPEMKNGFFPVMLYNMGGALLNVTAAALFFLLSLIMRDYLYVWTFLILLSMVGVGFAVLNGLPVRSALLNNDGANALELQRNEAARRAFWIQMKMNARVSEGVRLKDMPQEWFELPEETEMQSAMCASMAVFAANRLMDERKFAEADKFMEDTLEKEIALPGVYRYLLTNDRIYCELIGENRREIIDGMMTKEQKRAMRTLKSQLSILRTAYSYEVLQTGDTARAEAYEREFRKQMKTYPYPSEAEADLELMELAAGTRQSSTVEAEEKNEGSGNTMGASPKKEE